MMENAAALNIGTGGVTRLSISSGGNVGINETNPASKLEVNGVFGNPLTTGSAQNGIARFSQTLGNGVLDVGFGDNSGGFSWLQSRDSTNYATVYSLLLQPNGGNVGIGTTSPAGKLELQGSGQSWTTSPAIRMWDSYNSKGWLVGTANNITAGDFYIRTLPSIDGNPSSGEQEFTIKHANGNVGIGTTSPVTKTHISHTNVINDSYGLLLVENTSTSTGSATNSALNVKSKYGTSQFMQWEANGLRIGSRILTNGGTGDVIFTAGADSEKMRISSQGVVAVGTTPITDLFGATGSNPFQTLQVGGKAVIGSYKSASGAESMFANNIYVGSTHGTFQAVDATKNGSGVFCYSDRIDFKHAGTAANGSQGVNTRARVRAAGGITTFKKPLQIIGNGYNDEFILIASGATGTFTQLLVTIPAMNNPSGSNGYGGYSCEIYIAGYLYKYGHIMFGGYVNQGNYASEATILRSSGSFSASSANYQIQGMQFTVTFPSTIHPVGRIIFNKSGQGSTYPVDSITATFS
jgi:hypothetical protein